MKKQDTYHHGHLREALLETARALVQESGVEALTLREVARRAGVSTAAPYHHFSDKAALVDALAHQSLLDLDRRSIESLDSLSDPREKLSAIGVAYIMFAVERPAEFRLMFRPEMGTPLTMAEPSDAPVYRVLLQVVQELRQAGLGHGSVETGAITAWSLVHGLAALLVDGPLAVFRDDPVAVRALAIDVTRKLEAV